MQLPKSTTATHYCFLFVFSLLSLSSATAQEDLRIGQWRAHLPYQLAHYLAQSPTKIYATTEESIYSIDKSSDEVEFLSKVEGLSDVGMNLIKYDPFNEKLIAVYNNSNIDLIDDQNIINLPFITTSQGAGDKQVYDLFVEDENTTYMAMGFGLKELNVKNQEFGDETKADIRFNTVVVYKNAVYAGTDEGIYRFDRATKTNIQDFGEWDFLGSDEGFPEDYSVSTMAVFEDNLYTNIGADLYRYDGNSLDSILSKENNYVHYLNGDSRRLVIGMRCCIPDDNCDCSNDCTTNCNSIVYFRKTDGTITNNGAGCANRTRYAIEDEKGQVWYADDWRRLRMGPAFYKDCETQLSYNSPLTSSVSEIVIHEEDMWVSTTRQSILNKTDPSGLFSFIDNEWTNYITDQEGALEGLNGFITLAVNPSNKNVYAGTIDDGLVEFVLDTDDSGNQSYKATVRYTEGNSTLRSSSLTERVRVTGLEFDNENNLWAVNYGAQQPLSVFKNDGTWSNDFINIPFQNVRYLVVDDLGYKWFAVDGSGQALVVYDDNGTLDDSSDDRFRTFSSSNSEISSNFVFSLEKDLDGDIWVGTTEGIVIFECGANVFDESCRGSRRILEVDGFNAYLLESEEVSAIAVDGANRKWVGTGNGVFVLAPNGEEQLAFFDKSNSPIFDNQINTIAVNQINGEVFIGTAKGLLSYRSDAVKGGSTNSSNALVFPNPVRPEYDGPIAIKGLARDANVKITDVNGQLIYETTALGGQAIWDGRDYNGRKASSGVYLVFSTNALNLNSPDAIVGKILFMK
ncbi:MAG: hypothetical protein AB8F74_20450 [Saprospiraceae bacterium]